MIFLGMRIGSSWLLHRYLVKLKYLLLFASDLSWTYYILAKANQRFAEVLSSAGKNVEKICKDTAQWTFLKIILESS